MASAYPPAKSRSPTSRRKKRRHSPPPDPKNPAGPLNLLHLIPPPDPNSDESEDELPERSTKRLNEPQERSAKRRKADGGGTYHNDWVGRVNPAFQPRSPSDRHREVPNSSDRRGPNPVNKKRDSRKDSADDDDDDDDASSSDDRDYRAIPMNSSPPKFNSNNVKSARAYDYSSDESPASPASEASEENFNFGARANGGSIRSSRFVYDNASDLSSGEETSIPGTIPHLNGRRQVTQKAPGRAISELRAGEQAVAESLDPQDGSERSQVRPEQESDDDLSDRSSQVGDPLQPESSGGSDDQSEDERKYLPSRFAPGQTARGADAGADDLTEESAGEESGSSDPEEEPARDQTTDALGAGAKEPTEESAGKQFDGSGLKKESDLPQAIKAPNAGAERQSRSRGKNPRTPSVPASQPGGEPRDRKSRLAPSSNAKQAPERLGRLGAREEQTLNGTIEEFLAINGLTEKNIPSLVKGEIEDTSEARRLHDKFWKDVYESLPHRTPRYLRAILKRKHISYSAKKEWTTEEDARLVQLAKEQDQNKNKWLCIGQILGRTANECRDRHRNYALCGTARTVGLWQANDLRALLQAISKFISEDSQDGDRAYEDVPEYPVDWMKVSAEMGGRRSRQQCLAKWKKMLVNPNKVRVRQLLHGRQSGVSPQLRVVLMQVYSTPEASLRRFVQAVAEHVPEGDKPIPWRKLAGGALTRELRVETLNIIWVRLRKGLAGGMRDKSDQECARRIYEKADDTDEERCLERVVAEQEDVEAEEGIMSEPGKGLSTRASFMVGK